MFHKESTVDPGASGCTPLLYEHALRPHSPACACQIHTCMQNRSLFKLSRPASSTTHLRLTTQDSRCDDHGAWLSCLALSPDTSA
eukprot:scaffold115508_cov14-Tisochrysis_lutea.AAC.1